MRIQAFLRREDGEIERPAWGDLTPARQAAIVLSVKIGMPRLDRETLAEFSRRAAIYEGLFGSCLWDAGEPVVLTESDWLAALDGYRQISTNASPLTVKRFDRMMSKERNKH